MNQVDIYCDGACSGNPGPAGIGIVIIVDDKISLRYGEFIGRATNNIAELTAILRALTLINRYYKCYFTSSICSITIHSDSMYAINCANDTFTITKNKDIIKEIREYIANCKDDLTFEYVKGHNGDKYNELADVLAREAILRR